MSAETKEKIQKIYRSFEVVQEGAKRLAEEAKPLDKELARKIDEVSKSAEQVTKHITERRNG